MRHQRLKFRSEFRVVPGSRGGQCAEMVIPPGGSEGRPDNRHRGADQWLFMLSGSGAAIGKGRRVLLGAGSLLFIARGERHQIRNTGRAPLRTLNFYAPPAYGRSGEPLPRGRK